jgi:histidinol-phosphatase (PHP family)
MEDYQNQIDHVLKELIHQKKSLEVNTSGLRQKMGTTMPNEKILRRYRSFGGSMVTVGSDAHRWADVGSGIEETFSMLQRIGFSHFTIYEKRTPVQVPILD